MTDPRTYQAPPNLLNDRVILVTGAGRGIGRAAALAFAARGATVILQGRKVKALEAAYDEIVAAGRPQPAIFPLDMEKAEDTDFNAMAQGIAEQLGRLDGILHNAVANFVPVGLEHYKLVEWLSQLRVNLAAPAALTRACLPLLRHSPDASVVMTSDTHARKPGTFWSGLAISKAGVEMLVRIQAEEWDGTPSLRINAVVPGPVHSPQRQRTHPGELKDQLPKPEDLMPVYLYLMGPDSRGVTGQVFSCQP
ncbi:MAG TPA: SDR family NAD(P)-dependent oxidoreductase [Burkholderiales bacterium]|nr:SDR family NAD(P)-dependent oxidoreductase [Burkholderiales bacterium]